MLRDVPTNTHDGMCLEGFWEEPDGTVRSSLAFDGTNDLIQITSEPDLENPAG